MRLHELTLTAFGPFAGTETVDFDALNDAGLFLLTGATGAGKTSILDAVCFALYGAVPGVRGVKALKSQHADDLITPEVVLDFSVRERRFRIRRSPEWSRPKRRGTGTRVEPARASLLELIDGEERLLTSRAAEVGLEISELIGMRAAQFQQVAMLPQGDFARFLHASSQDRHDVLQQLFQTDRFSRIEEWVHDHSRSLREQAGDLERDVRRLLDLVADRAAVPLPEELSGEALPAATPAVPGWVAERVAEAGAAAEAARERHEVASAALTGARTRCEAARLRHRMQQRREEALVRRRELEETAEQATVATAALDTDRRARACLPALALVAQAEDDVRRLQDELERAGRAAPRRPDGLHRLLEHREALQREAREVPQEAEQMLPGLWPEPSEEIDQMLPGLGPEPSDLCEPTGPAEATGQATSSAQATSSGDADPSRRRLSALQGLADDLRAVLPQVRRLQGDADRADALRRQVEATRRDHDEQQALLGELPEELSALATLAEQQRDDAARVETRELQVTAAEDVAVAADALPTALERLAGLEESARDLRDAEADAREHVLRLTERRLDGMAAELAGALRDGDPCQVCGSPDHPRPAAAGSDPVSAEEQQDSTEALEVARQRHLGILAEVADARRDVDDLRRRARGRDADAARAELDGLRRELAGARAARAALQQTTARLRSLEARREAAASRLQETAVRLASDERAAQELDEAMRTARDDLAAALGPEVAPATVPALLEALEAESAALEHQVNLGTSLERAAARLTEVTAAADRIAGEQGFADLVGVRAAVLGEQDRVAAEELLARRAEAVARVDAVLDDPDVAALDHAGPADVARTEAEVAEAEADAAETARTVHHAEQLAQHLTDLERRLGAALEAWAPLRESFVTADSMARLVRGTGHDNQLQMRLSAYVLARRLDQVLDAANERLDHMRDHRYLLQRTARAARRSSQAGLGLEVLDQWTGEVRDPTTLSGGETFVVSLALALGLADVVTQEAGGTQIETLFVDEGFGTLDAETLDDVMDRLDGLRAGGRSVGVVSHVAELRTRIPTQLHVAKTPRGSSVQTRLLVG